MTIVDIGCYGGCANTVIGQCQGHRRGCGRFYCAEHNADRLCYDCGADLSRDLEAEARYPGYVSAAFRLAAAEQTRRSRQQVTVGAGVLFLVLFVIAVGDVEIPRVPGRAVTAAAWILFGVVVGAGLLWWRSHQVGRYLRERYDEEPGLSQFASLWERQWRDRSTDGQDPRHRDRLVGLISAALINPVRRDDPEPGRDPDQASGAGPGELADPSDPTDVLGQKPA